MHQQQNDIDYHTWHGIDLCLSMCWTAVSSLQNPSASESERNKEEKLSGEPRVFIGWWLVINPPPVICSELETIFAWQSFQRRWNLTLSAADNDSELNEVAKHSKGFLLDQKNAPFLQLNFPLLSQQTIVTLHRQNPTIPDTKVPSDFDLGSIAPRRGVCQFDDFESSDQGK